MDAYVRKDGCIRLGTSVTCDGFETDAPFRIQSHIHTDHLKDFERSKGSQKILLTPATLALLIAELNADLKYRSNLLQINADSQFRQFDDTLIAFYPSGHIIGGVMPVVQALDGQTYAYTSDFSWPLTQWPQNVDVLVVDATYGDPALIRNYSPNDIADALLTVVRDELRTGSVMFIGHRGRLQAAAQLLVDHFRQPMLFTRNAMKSLQVFEQYRGFNVAAIEFSSEEAKRLLRTGERCFIFAESRDRKEIDQANVARRVFLSPYMVPHEAPVATYDKFVRVAFTDHADFKGTIDLIQAIAPKFVIADNSRGGNADKLAEYVREELKIAATSEVKNTGRLWGQG